MARFAYALALTALIPFSMSAQAPPQLQGVWEISTLIEDGTVLSAADMKKLFKDGRLSIRDDVLSFTRSDDGRVRNLPFILNAKASPAAIDLFGSEKVGTKGIYMAHGDSVVVCFPESGTAERPTSFSSGEGYLLLTLRRVEAAPPPPAEIEPTTPTPTPGATAKVTPDPDYRRRLIGTWGHRDDRKTQTITFNPDGTFATTRQWKGAFRSLFEGDTRTSGNWKVEDGVVIMTVNASTDRNLRGQIISYRIQSLTDTEVIYIDSMGEAHREWRVR